MNWQSWLVLAAGVLALGAAVIAIVKNRGKSCGGDCARCSQSCQNRK